MIGLLTARGSEPPVGGEGQGSLVDRRLLTRPFAALFGANLALGLYFGAIPVTITAFAAAQRVPALAGPISAAGGVVSLMSGLAYGTVAGRRPLRTMIGAATMITVGVAALALVPGVALMFGGYAVVGGGVALVLIPSAVLLQRSTAPAVYTQAMTWLNSASAVGIAVAAPLVGQVVQAHGWRAGFVATGLLTAGLPATVLATHRYLATASRDSG